MASCMLFTQLLIIKYEYNCFTAYFKDIKEFYKCPHKRRKKEKRPNSREQIFPLNKVNLTRTGGLILKSLLL